MAWTAAARGAEDDDLNVDSASGEDCGTEDNGEAGASVATGVAAGGGGGGDCGARESSSVGAEEAVTAC